MTQTLPDGVSLAFYGDDFTGSTDAMAVMAFAGLKTVLFTGEPSDDDRLKFADYEVVGVAGTARARNPEWMDDHLPAVFGALTKFNPAILHYKTCSTFDSSPQIGSIGRAIDIGMRVTGAEWTPSVVGAPQLKRWQAFSHLFAGGGNGRTYRIDRHPTMSRHPVTPMSEADLRLHLSQQTERCVEGISFPDLHPLICDQRIAEARQHGSVLFLDVVDEHTQMLAGRAVWQNRSGILFTASSSGLQYALVAHWRDAGLIQPAEAAMPRVAPVEQILVLSGSCSPATATQIEFAEANGFFGIRLDILRIVEPIAAKDEIHRIVTDALRALAAGQSVLIYTAKTVDDDAFHRLRAYCDRSGMPFQDAQAALGEALGAIAKRLVSEAGLKRALFAGGDTAGRIMGQLPVSALEAVDPFVPGAPICKVHSDDPDFAELQIVLKGGQLSGERLFLDARDGVRAT